MAGPQANIPVLRLLLTEDNPADAELELRELKRAGLRIAHRIADTEQGFVSALREFSPDVILSDFSMPGFDGMAALALARDLAPDTPFVFVSGTLGEEYAIRALRNGATDYVLKTNLVRLPAAVERAFTESKERRERRRLTRIREFSSRINWALVRLRERDELFAAISRIAVEVGGLRGARIGMLDPGTKDVIWRAWFGSWSEGSGPDALQASAREDESGSGLAGKALRALAPAISNDIANDSGVRSREKFLSFGVRAMAAFPLVVDGAAAGVLGLLASEVGYFDQDEVNLLAELAANVSFALELMRKQDRITYLALYDPLTGLPNRTLFHERLTQSLQSAGRNNASLALVLIDLERFKAINDTLGQQAGDGVLQAVAQRLGSAAGDINRLARLGSNLFADDAPADQRRRGGGALARAGVGAGFRHAVHRRRPRGAPRGEGRHRDISRGRRRRRRAAAQRRGVAQAGEANRRGLPVLCAAHQRARVRGGRARAPAAQSGRAGRAVPALPAQARPRDAPHRRAGGADALEGARRRTGPAGDVHPGAGADGADPRGRPAGDRRSDRDVPELAGAGSRGAAHRRERVAAAAAPQELRG